MPEFTLSWAAARVNASLTQEQACKALKISKPSLINWELGRTEPMFSKAKQMAALYGVSLDIISAIKDNNRKIPPA